MNTKQKIKIIIDFAMLLLLPILMAYSLVGETAHEWLGIAMTALFLLHQLLNLGWYKNLLRGKYTAFRTALTITNGLLIVDFLLLIYSGIDLSKHLLPLLPELGSATLSRILHLSCSHWGLLLMSFHLGLHISRFTSLIKHQALRNALTVLTCLIALYGSYAFIARDFVAYLLPASAFIFFDASQPLAHLLADLCAMMILFVLLGHITTKITQHKRIKGE